MEAVGTSETSVNFYQTAQRNIPGNHFFPRRLENLKSHGMSSSSEASVLTSAGANPTCTPPQVTSLIPTYCQLVNPYLSVNSQDGYTVNQLAIQSVNELVNQQISQVSHSLHSILMLCKKMLT
jgi:hypothetical protein